MALDPQQKQVETLRERIQNGERDVSEADAQVLIDFSNQLKLMREKYGWHRHLKLLRHCTRMAEHPGGLADALEQKEAAENIVRWIHSEYDNEETNRDYRVALRIFSKRVTDGDEIPTDDDGIPKSVSWVSSETPQNYDPAPDPADMLDLEDDVKPMIEATRNPRDAAFIGMQYEAGLRGGELLDLTVGDVSDADHGTHIRVDGKTGQRSVLLTTDFAITNLQQWLHRGSNGHPAPDNPDAPLWSKLNKAESMSRQRFYQFLRETAERADVTKPVTPTNFRKSNLYWLARHRDVPQTLIEERQGRKPGSPIVSRYIARFGDEADQQYARKMGKEVETSEPESHAPIDCPRCGQETPRNRDECVFCGQALEYDTETLRERREEKKQVRAAALKIAGDNPELLDEIEGAQSMMDLFEENPELHAEAQEFVEALSDG